MPRSALRALELAVRHQEPEQVREELTRLTPDLGGQVRPLLALADQALLTEARRLTKTIRARRRVRSQADALRRADAQLERLRSTASPYRDGVTVLGPADLLHQDLVRAPGMRLFELRTPDFEVVVLLDILRRARPLLLPKPDLTAFLDAEGLHLRWNLGRGGLDLRHDRALTHEDRQRMLTITFEPPVVRRPGAWLGDILTDVGWVS